MLLTTIHTSASSASLFVENDMHLRHVRRLRLTATLPGESLVHSEVRFNERRIIVQCSLERQHGVENITVITRLLQPLKHFCRGFSHTAVSRVALHKQEELTTRVRLVVSAPVSPWHRVCIARAAARNASGAPG